MSEMKGQLLAGSKLDEPVSGVSSLEVCVDERHRFFLVAWHEVPIEIEGRLDRYGGFFRSGDTCDSSAIAACRPAPL